MEPTAPPSSRPVWLSDLWRIGFVMLLAFSVRYWVVRHTEVLSRDSIAFIRFALQLEQPPDDPRNPGTPLSRVAVLKASPHPPGYPLLIWGVSIPVRSIMGGTTCDSMVLSAQLASILSALLLVIPMYFLGKMLFDRQTAFIGAMLFQVLPVFSQVTSDGLSDGLFLLMAALTLWLGAIAFRRTSAVWFAAAGLSAGLAYLVRPEGLVLIFAMGLVLGGLKLRGARAWRPTLAHGSALAAGLLIVMVPYVAAIERLTNKPTGMSIFKWLGGEDLKPTWQREQTLESDPVVGVPLAEWYRGPGSRTMWGAKAVAIEVGKTAFFVMPLFALIGLVLLRSRIRTEASLALLVVLACCHLLLLWVTASGAGYVAERHTLLVVLCGTFFTAAAIPMFGNQLATIRGLSRLNGSAWAVVTSLILVAGCIPAGMKTLHANRAGNHAAGLWLAQRITPTDLVLDPFAWSEFYAGHIRLPDSSQRHFEVVYVVVDKLVDKMDDSPHPRLHLMPLAQSVAKNGEVVYHWPEEQPRSQAKLFIYRWDVKAANEKREREGLPPAADNLAWGK